MFDFHSLDVYKKARIVNLVVLNYLKINRSAEKSLKDQLFRASNSVILNIAEGSGRNSKSDRKHFYIIAKGSVYECASILDIFYDLKYLNDNKYKDLTEALEEVARMLFGLIKSME